MIYFKSDQAPGVTNGIKTDTADALYGGVNTCMIGPKKQIFVRQPSASVSP